VALVVPGETGRLAALKRRAVRRRHDADSSAALDDVSQDFAQVADAGPDHERTDQIDGVRRSKLGAELRADVRLALGV
jgi:hypothetical protein